LDSEVLFYLNYEIMLNNQCEETGHIIINHTPKSHNNITREP